MRGSRELAIALLALLGTACDFAQSSNTPQPGLDRPTTNGRPPDPQTDPGAHGATSQHGTPATQPATRPILIPGTISQRHNELIRLKNQRLDEKELALRAALEFLIAVGSADGVAAANVLETIGFQPLPLGRTLPNPPLPLITVESLKKSVSARKPVPIRDLPMEAVEIVGRDRLRVLAPAMAHWMLSSDWAVILDGENASSIFSEPAVLIVRVRAGRPTIMGGNLLSALR